MSKRHGTSTIEIERKYDVTETAGAPAFVGVGPIAVIEAPELRELDAVYYDTTDLKLAHARVALRRREGGPDAGWHIKRDVEEGRMEQHWSLGIEADDRAVVSDSRESDEARASVPQFLVEELSDLIGEAELVPIARVRTRRPPLPGGSATSASSTERASPGRMVTARMKLLRTRPEHNGTRPGRFQPRERRFVATRRCEREAAGFQGRLNGPAKPTQGGPHPSKGSLQAPSGRGPAPRSPGNRRA